MVNRDASSPEASESIKPPPWTRKPASRSAATPLASMGSETNRTWCCIARSVLSLLGLKALAGSSSVAGCGSAFGAGAGAGAGADSPFCHS